VVTYHWGLPASLAITTRVAIPARILRFRTLWRLYSCETLLEWLPQDLQDVAAELRPFIQEAHAVVRERHLARPRRVAPADQPHTQDGLRGARHTRAVTAAHVRPSQGRLGGVRLQAPIVPLVSSIPTGRSCSLWRSARVPRSPP
jgi:hypothetical protein